MSTQIRDMHGARNHMVKYLNHTDYNRWYRNYIINLTRYAAELDNLRLILDDLPGKERVESKFEEIDEKIDDIIPRNFDRGGKPLLPSEVFVENIKIIINLGFKVFNAPLPFQGIYQSEKEKILKKHQEYRFKDQFKDLKSRVEHMIEEYQKIEKEKMEAEKALKVAQEKAEKEMHEKAVEASQVSNASEMASTPGTPEAPGIPETPITPPVRPDIPVTPEAPGLPETPTTPETPGTPNPPVTPQKPGTSGTSGSKNTK